MPDATDADARRGEAAETVFDAIPFPAIVVDRDVRVLDYNLSAAGMLGPDRKFHYRSKAGHVLHCIHADETPEGCGHSTFCPDCLVRNTVNESAADGKVHRKRARLERRSGGKKENVVLMLSVSPFRLGTETRYLMLFEDVADLMHLERILPICSHCKKIRDERNYWANVEEYFLTHTDLMFSHSLCDECRKDLYPSMEK
jgi:PAS domain-containing protein